MTQVGPKAFVVEILLTAGPGSMLDHQVMVVDTEKTARAADTLIEDIIDFHVPDIVRQGRAAEFTLVVKPLDHGDTYAPA